MTCLASYCELCGASLFNISEFRLSTSAFSLYTCKAWVGELAVSAGISRDFRILTSSDVQLLVNSAQ